MPSLVAILAPFALLIPLGLTGLGDGTDAGAASLADGSEAAVVGQGREWSPLADPGETPVYNQVRIERRVIVRISPRSATSRSSLMTELPRTAIPRRMVERPMGNCIDIADIAGVQTGRGSRLMLFMRDQRIISAELERACQARDFYSGFYLERNEDGRLCVDRDRLLSRNGARCQIDGMRRLVADDGRR